MFPPFTDGGEIPPEKVEFFHHQQAGGKIPP